MIKKFITYDLDYYKKVIINNDVSISASVIALLETENADIELTIDVVDNEMLDIYYYCCIKTKENDDDSWESYDFVDNAEFDISQLESESILKDYMYDQLVKYTTKHNLQL